MAEAVRARAAFSTGSSARPQPPSEPGRRVSPPGYVDSVRRRLTIAGRGRQIDTNQFLAGRVATIALIPVAFIGVELSSFPKLYRLLAFLILFLLLLGPEARLNREAEARQNKMRRISLRSWTSDDQRRGRARL